MTPYTAVNPVDRSQPSARTTPRKPFVAKGHDAQLQDAQFSKHEVVVTLISGEYLSGYISRRDKWTITVAVQEAGSSNDIIVYKHAIETVAIKRSQPVTGEH